MTPENSKLTTLETNLEPERKILHVSLQGRVANPGKKSHNICPAEVLDIEPLSQSLVAVSIRAQE